jgi:hypothetical protein
MNPPDMLFEKFLRKAKKLVFSWGGNINFVYIPSFDRVVGNIDIDSNDFFKTKVFSLVKKVNIDLIDFTLPAYSHPDSLSLYPFRMNNHFSPKGYKLLATTIDNYVRKKAN